MPMGHVALFPSTRASSGPVRYDPSPIKLLNDFNGFARVTEDTAIGELGFICDE